MKICFFLHSMNSGGTERVTSGLANLYSAAGHEISVITVSGAASFYQLSDGVRHIRLDLEKSSANKIQAIYMNVKRIAALKKALNKLSPDVIVAMTTTAQMLVCFASFGKKRLVGSERANPFLTESSLWRRIKKLVSRRCDGFIFQTAGAAAYYPASVQRRGLIVQNGIDAHAFEAADCVWTSKKNICAVGRMDESKGFADIIRAFAIVHEQAPELVLNLYGDGPERAGLEKLVRNTGLDNCVLFRGHCKEMYKVYSSHKYMLMMSREEGFPNVLLEAMAGGCACVSTDCDFGPSELIRQGENGFLVPVHDYDAAAEKLLCLIKDDALAEKMAKEAMKVRTTNNNEVIAMKIYHYIKDC